MSGDGSFRLGLSRVEDLIDSSPGGYDLIYIDPPFGLQRELHMTEADGTRKSFQDSWSNYDEYIEWLAGVIDGLYGLLKKDGWLYSHNQVEGNFLALGKVDNKVRRSYYTNISWARSHPHNNIRVGFGNIVDSIMVIRKGEPFFQVEHAPLDPTYAANSFGHEDERGNYALAPVTGEKSRLGTSTSTRGTHRPSVGVTQRRGLGSWTSRD